jgi:maltokinase
MLPEGGFVYGRRMRQEAAPVPLVEMLRPAWPPLDLAEGRGYRPLPLADLRPIDALALSEDGSLLVAVLGGHDGSRTALPLARQDAGWRVALPGDGAAEALVALLSDDGQVVEPFRLDRVTPVGRHEGERTVGVDQTNRSVVVGEAVVVKWYTRPGVDGRRAAVLLAHLAAAGSPSVPRLDGVLTWRGDQGRQLVLAVVEEHVRGSRDGWDWCADAVVEHVTDGHRCLPGCPAAFAPDLGLLVACLHVDLATPSPWMPEPAGIAGRQELAAWLASARTDLESAVALEADDRARFVERQARLLADMDLLAAVDRVATQPIHGDLHVGQVLRSETGMRVIDFDATPGSPTADGDRHPAARDVAHLLLSLELVAEVARSRVPAGRAQSAGDWARRARADMLDAYRSELASRAGVTTLDESLLRPFMAHQLCRELLYAASTLPRWRYAPMGALARLYPTAAA